MQAMVLEKIGAPLALRELPMPLPRKGEVLVQVKACAVCRTDIHIIDGEVIPPKLPLILGHQIIGRITSKSSCYEQGELVGAGWLFGSCGTCPYCMRKEENLCDAVELTGFTRHGGFAQYCSLREDSLFKIPSFYSETEAAPLMCAGVIGYRALKKAQSAQKIGFYGFGAASHLLIQVARLQGKEVFVFTKEGDIKGQAKGRALGAVWSGDSLTLPPTPLDAAIIFAPVGALIPKALQAVRKGGVVICSGIHMSDIPSFAYALLWGERALQSIAHLKRKEAEEFLEIAPQIPVKTETTLFPLEQTNEALQAVRQGKISGSAVITL